MAVAKKKPTRRAKANKLANNQIHQTVSQIKHNLQLTKQNRVNTVQHARTDYRNARDDVNDIYNAVQAQLAASQGRINTGYQDTTNQVSQANAALIAQLNQTSAANQVAAQAEQARLGIQQSGMGNFASDAANQINVANQNNSDELANLHLGQVGAQSIAELLKGMNSGQRLSSMGKLAVGRNDAISQARESYNQQQLASHNSILEAKQKHDQLVQEILASMPRPASRRNFTYNPSHYYNSGGGGGSSYVPHYSSGSGSSNSYGTSNANAQLALLQNTGYPKGTKPKPKPKVKHKKPKVGPHKNADGQNSYLDFFMSQMGLLK